MTKDSISIEMVWPIAFRSGPSQLADRLYAAVPPRAMRATPISKVGSTVAARRRVLRVLAFVPQLASLNYPIKTASRAAHEFRGANPLRRSLGSSYSGLLKCSPFGLALRVFAQASNAAIFTPKMRRKCIIQCRSASNDFGETRRFESVRLSTLAPCALIAVLAATVAGCSSNPPGSQTLPVGSSGVTQSIANQPSGVGAVGQNESKRQEELLKQQIAGKMPSPITRSGLRHILKELERNPRPLVKPNRSKDVGLWVSSPYYDYIFGQSANGERTYAAIDTYSNGCYDPYGIKVDGSNNLWVACYSSSLGNGAVQEYASGAGTLSATYYEDLSCSGSPPSCYFQGYGNDVAFDSNGHVFESGSGYYCTYVSSSYVCTYGGYILWWSAGSPSSPPGLIHDPNLEYRGDDFLDADNADNLYVGGYGCVASSSCGYIVDEIKHPTRASRTIANLIPPGTIEYIGGVYVSNDGTILNVTDQDTRKTLRYALPWTGEQLHSLGPTKENLSGYGEPVMGGFNQGDASQALGDVYGWIDIERVAKHKRSAVANYNFSYENVFGAAYVPSDK
jgi:hypothetical protein